MNQSHYRHRQRSQIHGLPAAMLAFADAGTGCLRSAEVTYFKPRRYLFVWAGRSRMRSCQSISSM
ncbi:MAG: hypothetical protein II151_00470, partial [Bacteroidales bacterium]|nr:hypothetical protein [Bacteroidales bacterium]